MTPRRQDKISVLICDPHPLLREGIMSVLSREPDVEIIGDVAAPDEAIEMGAVTAPTVIVLPHKPAAFDGVAMTHRLAEREATRKAAVLLFVEDASERDLVLALRAGARGLLARDAPLPSLVTVVRNIADGAVVVALPSAAHLLRRMSSLLPARYLEHAHGATAKLTSREVDVLLLVARGRSNKAIAEELMLSTATVKSHLYHLCQKLNLRDRTEAVIFAYETGLVSACDR